MKVLSKSTLTAAVVRAGLAVLVAIQLGGPARAQDEDLETRYRTLFQQLIESPDDPAIMVEFANVATRLGNYEAAIVTLERMLIMDPSLTRVKLELGVLYYRLGAHEIARTYLQKALDDGTLSPEDEARAREFMGTVEERRSGHLFKGEVIAGMRFQTNANHGPSSSGVLNMDNLVALPKTSAPRRDVDTFFSFSGEHRYDLGTPVGDDWRTGLQAFYSRPLHVETVELGFIALDTGPHLAVLPGTVDNLFIRPYAKADFAVLRHEPLKYSYGGGLEIEKYYDEDTRVFATYEGMFNEFVSSGGGTELEGHSGVEHSLEVGTEIPLHTDVILGLTGEYVRDNSDDDPFRTDTYGAKVSLMTRYDAPGDIVPWPWEFFIEGRYAFEDYAEPDSRVSATLAREDEIYSVRIANRFRITRDVSVIASAKYTVNFSNLPNYEYDNTSVLVGASWRF